MKLDWIPRILALLYAGFISLFALDSLEAHGTFWERLGHVLAHLAPTAVVLAALWLAWHRRLIGALVFMVLGMLFTIQYGTWRSAALFWTFSMPLFLTGVGFFVAQYFSKSNTLPRA